MGCQFSEYPVAKYGEEAIKLAGRIWNETVDTVKNAIIRKENIVITVLGQPGMGKTTLLNKVKHELSNSFIIYLDLVSAESLSDEAWKYINNTKLYETVRSRAFNDLEKNKKQIGYNLFESIKREFHNWLKHQCENADNFQKKEKLPILRLYCMKYKEDIDGLVNFMNDLTELSIVGILIDELKAVDKVLSELHKLINEVKIPIIVTLTPDNIEKIEDKALRRRLDEHKVELVLSEQDKKEILKAYCSEFADILLDLEDVRNSTTVSELIDRARETYNYANKACENEYNKEQCIRDNIGRSFIIENPEDASKQLEEKIRDGLQALKEEYGINYVHSKGKKIELGGKYVIADLYFYKENTVYIGDVKLSNKKSLENIDNMEKLADLDKYESRQVAKFLVTNNSNVDLSTFEVITFNNREIKKVLESNDKETIKQFVMKILDKLGIKKQPQSTS